MGIFIACAAITIAFLGVMYIWGRAFLQWIQAELRISDCILFGFTLINTVFQIPYLPFLLTRGSFRSLAILWTVMLIVLTALLALYLHRKKHDKTSPVRMNTAQWIGLGLVIAVNIFLCVYIGIRPRHNGVDTIQYVWRMNEMVYQDNLWINGATLEVHQGLNSFYSLFAVISWWTGILPLFMNYFTMRFLGVIFASTMAYRFGRIAFGAKEKEISGYALAVAALVPLAMMIWNTGYGTGLFFYERANESKTYCQILLFPLSVSILVQMLREDIARSILWKQQLLVGLSAIPMAVSSMSIYPVILFTGMLTLLVYDKFRGSLKTILCSAGCAIPNLLYMVLYILYKQQIIRF